MGVAIYLDTYRVIKFKFQIVSRTIVSSYNNTIARKWLF
jgi:hypothetical protein